LGKNFFFLMKAIIPYLSSSANKLNRKNSRQWVGIRREEGGRLGGAAGGNLKDRAFTTSLGERHGFDVPKNSPLAYLMPIKSLVAFLYSVTFTSNSFISSILDSSISANSRTTNLTVKTLGNGWELDARKVGV
jgi:hypothetical protein